MSEQFHIVYDPDPRLWDDFICARGGHLLQSAAWGELKSRFGWTTQRIVLERGDALIAGAQILFRRLPLGLQFAYVPRGPVADPQDREALGGLLDALCASARERGAFALKIEPNWLDEFPSPSQGEGTRVGVGAWLGMHDFRSGSCFQPHTTFHVELTRDLDSILARMKPKWRYNIRLAERKGVQVRAGSANDLALFYDLLQITSKRDGFAIHSFDYYRAVFDLLTAQERARLLIAEYEREPLAAIFVTAHAKSAGSSTFGREAIYLYGASSNAHRERMPNHALHWAAMQWAKARGCTHYDLWGVGATAEAAVGTIHESPLQHGLHQFKQGFGGSVVRYVGGYDAIFSRIKFALYERALALRRGALG